MGWIYDVDGKRNHEGYVVGLVHRVSKDGTRELPELFRELAYPHDEERVTAVRLQAGCDCGWRSPHWLPWGVTTARWAPYSVLAHERDEERAHGLWRAHVEELCP